MWFSKFKDPSNHFKALPIDRPPIAGEARDYGGPIHRWLRLRHGGGEYGTRPRQLGVGHSRLDVSSQGVSRWESVLEFFPTWNLRTRLV